MLVRKVEAIEAEGVTCALGWESLELLDQAFAAAGVAGDGVDGDGHGGVHEPRCNQWRHQADEAGGIAAGVGDALRALDQHAVSVGHFGEAVDPVRINAVRGRGVDDDGVGVGDELHRFLRCIVGQAEDDGVGVIHKFGARGGILAALGRN